jgi:SpoVK/Ycf46/Vps4 family AAA+-type ATPase
LTKLRQYIEKIEENFKILRMNQLGSYKYYFNEFPNIPMKNMDGTYRFDTSSKNIYFDMTKFYTNKSLNNIFGEEIEEIKNRVDLFINDKKWYEKRGIPHTLGILLHGPPGTGKTSTIKAIAKDTNRHIINISLRETTTQSQLRNLFFNDTGRRQDQCRKGLAAERTD